MSRDILAQTALEALGCQMCLPLNGNTKDISGAGNHGTPTNVTYSKLRSGEKAGVFDKTAKIVTPTINLGNVRTTCIWVKPALYDFGDCYAVTTGFRFTTVTYADGHITHGLGNGSTWYNLASTPANVLETGKWSFICCTADGTNIDVYVDCVHKATAVDSNSFNYPISLGMRGAIYPYEGAEAWAMAFNQKLTVNQMKALYKATYNE